MVKGRILLYRVEAGAVVTTPRLESRWAFSFPGRRFL